MNQLLFTSPGHAAPIPSPAPPTDPAALPHALTFFLSADQRAAVLRALRKKSRHPDRTLALLHALNINAPAANTKGDQP